MDEQAEWRGEQHKNISDCERVALAFEALADNGNALALVNRYEARLQHDYHRILKSLYQMQATRATEVKLPNRANPIYEHPPEPPQVAAPPILDQSDSEPDSEPRP